MYYNIFLYIKQKFNEKKYKKLKEIKNIRYLLNDIIEITQKCLKTLIRKQETLIIVDEYDIKHTEKFDKELKYFFYEVLLPKLQITKNYEFFLNFINKHRYQKNIINITVNMAIEVLIMKK